MGFFTHPQLVALANAAFNEQLRQSRDLAESLGLAEEFDRALRENSPMH
jgi:hypothetical protein